MSPNRSNAIARPSGATSTFIQLPSSTDSWMLRVARPGGALTSHLSSFFASASGAACAQTEVEQARVAARARAKRAMILSPFEIMCRAYGPGANMQVAAFDEGAGRLDGRSEEHTSELQSLKRISDTVFCFKKKK